MPIGNKPIVLGAQTRNKTDSVFKFAQYADFKQTHTLSDTPNFMINRLAAFSYKNRVNYKVISNWEIAEHKSQGATQMTMNNGDYEEFWFFKMNGAAGMQKCAGRFSNLKITPDVPNKY